MNMFNRCLSGAEFVLKDGYASVFSQNVLTNLTPTQKKVAAIAGLAFLVLTTLFIAYQYCFTNNNNASPKPSPLTQPIRVSSPPKPTSPIPTPKSYFDAEPSKSPEDGPPQNLDAFYKPASSDPFGVHVKLPTQDPYAAPKRDFFIPQDYAYDDEEEENLIKSFYPKKTDPVKAPSPDILHRDPFGYQSKPPIIDPFVYKPKAQVVSPVYDPVPNPGYVDPFAAPKSAEPAVHQPVQQPYHDPVLTPLFNIEKLIRNLLTEIQDERDMLAVLQDGAGGIIADGMFPEQEEKIKALLDKFHDALKEYPAIFGDYLINRFSNYGMGKKDHQEIFEHVVILTGIMKRHKNEQAFVQDALQQIDRFLSETFFTDPNQSCLQEEKKADLIVFHEFFTIVDEHYPFIQKQDPKLAQRLKIKLANLPLVDGHLVRENFKNIYLSENDQRQILLDYFKEGEDAAVDQVIQYVRTQAGNLTSVDVKRLTKLADMNKQRLLPHNLQKINDALGVYIKDSKNLFLGAQYFQAYGYNPLADLYKASKARRYFEQQPSIPRWYHTTKLEYLEKIIASGEIQVQHKQAYRGAWVSTEREPTITLGGGDAVLIFGHSISEIDGGEVFIGFEKGNEKKRWRGVQQPITICKPATPGQPDPTPYLALVGCGSGATKADKQRVIALLKSKGIKQPFVLSLDVIDYIKESVTRLVGNPNLTEKWWGKGDVKEMDKPLMG